LALGIEGVEGEGRLPRSGRTGQNRELPLGNLDRNVLEIVRPRSTNGDRASGHSIGERFRGDFSSRGGAAVEESARQKRRDSVGAAAGRRRSSRGARRAADRS